jgi:hypothetical protein
MTAMRPLLFLCAAMLVFAASATAADPVRATMSTSSTAPVVDTTWRYTIAVRDSSGRPLAAKVRLQVLLDDVVVGCWRGGAIEPCSGASAGTWIAFEGTRTGTLTWRASAVGARRTFLATVVARARSLKLRAPVTVRLP